MQRLSGVVRPSLPLGFTSFTGHLIREKLLDAFQSFNQNNVCLLPITVSKLCRVSTAQGKGLVQVFGMKIDSYALHKNLDLTKISDSSNWELQLYKSTAGTVRWYERPSVLYSEDIPYSCSTLQVLEYWLSSETYPESRLRRMQLSWSTSV